MRLQKSVFFVALLYFHTSIGMPGYYACPAVGHVNQALQNSLKSWNNPSPVMGPGGLVFQVQNTMPSLNPATSIDFVQSTEGFSTPFAPPAFTVTCNYKTQNGSNLAVTGQLMQSDCTIDHDAGPRLSQKDFFLKQGMYGMAGSHVEARYCQNPQNCLVKCHMPTMGFMGRGGSSIHPLAAHMIAQSTMGLGGALGSLIPH